MAKVIKKLKAPFVWLLAKALGFFARIVHRISESFADRRRKKGKYKPHEITTLAHGLISDKEKRCSCYKLIGIQPVPGAPEKLRVKYQVQYPGIKMAPMTREETFVLDGPIWPPDFVDDRDFFDFMAGKPYGKDREKMEKSYQKKMQKLIDKARKKMAKTGESVLIKAPDGKLLQLLSTKKD